jgi:hypothetical protein
MMVVSLANVMIYVLTALNISLIALISWPGPLLRNNAASYSSIFFSL